MTASPGGGNGGKGLGERPRKHRVRSGEVHETHMSIGRREREGTQKERSADSNPKPQPP